MIKVFKNLFGVQVNSEEEKLAIFHNYYLEHQSFVRNVIHRIVLSQSIADELVQDAFVNAWKSFDSFERRSAFRTWIYRLALNTTFDYLRKAKVRSQNLEIEKSSLAEIGRELELKDLVEVGLLELSEAQREVFILFYKFDHSVDEISQMLEVSIGTVKSRLHYGRDKFLEVLRRDGVLDEK